MRSTLREILTIADYWYGQARPILSDRGYDMLYQQLERLGDDDPDSPINSLWGRDLEQRVYEDDLMYLRDHLDKDHRDYGYILHLITEGEL